MPSATLRADAISFSYEPGHPVLRQVTCDFRRGAITAIIGPNGSGKSTLLRVLLGALQPAEGAASLGGRPVRTIPPTERAAQMAYLAQLPTLGFGYTVRQYVRLGLHSAGQDDDAPVDDALARVGLADRAPDRFDELSVGQQQRAALARALAQLGRRPQTGVLLADEPLSAMDPRRALESLALIRELAHSGATVVMALHDLSLAATWADDALLLSESGALAATGPAADTLSEHNLRALFGVRFERLLASDGSVAMAASRAEP